MEPKDKNTLAHSEHMWYTYARACLKVAVTSIPRVTGSQKHCRVSLKALGKKHANESHDLGLNGAVLSQVKTIRKTQHIVIAFKALGSAFVGEKANLNQWRGRTLERD